MNTLSVQDIAYHRNGVSGVPFYVVTFHDGEEGDMLAVVFDYEESDAYVPRFPTHARTAVFKRPLLAGGVIAFGENSYRGDRYDAFLRGAIAKHEREQADAIA